MSVEINWNTLIREWLDPERCCRFLTQKISDKIPGNAPISNLRFKQFDLRECSGPRLELIDLNDIRDEFLAAAGLCRNIQSPPPSDTKTDPKSFDAVNDASRDCVIDSSSLLYTRPAASLKDVILQDGLEAILHLSIREDALKIEFEADALLSIPTPGFLALPLKLSLTQLKMDGKFIVAAPAGFDRIFVALPAPLHEFDFQVSVDVGDSSKHVLRNVAKIERFLQEQIKIFMNDRMVLPQFIELPIKAP
jgi:hypothetical protein